MKIRHAHIEDLPEIMNIYAGARTFMAEHGNPRQWGSVWPPQSLIEDDIEKGCCYVAEENGELQATFYYTYGRDIDATYRVIEDGAWKDASPYGVVHRVASAGKVRGAGAFCINWAFEHCGHLRMDTHGDNKVMQSLLKKLGFEYCGIIYVEEDNDPRVAFEKTEDSSVLPEQELNIRTATVDDLDEITEIERVCFPAAEAAGRESFARRLSTYPEHFWVMEKGGQIISFINGMVTDEPDLKDEMYDNASLHKEDGDWQMIFGVDTLPEFQRHGYAGRMLDYVTEEARKQGRKGLVLTCKEKKIEFYARHGYKNEGESGSTHGDVLWYQMRNTL